MNRTASFGLTSSTALVVANMVGAGVFTTSGFALADLGDRNLVLAAWVIGGALALTGALSYGGLARHIAGSGGEYLFLSQAVHPAVGFVAGWVSLLAGFTGAIAFAATAFEAYTLPEVMRPSWLPQGATAIGLILFCGLLHGRVVRLGAFAQNLMVGIKLVFLGAFIAYAAIRWSDSAWPGLAEAAVPAVLDEHRAFSLVAFAGSLVWISLSYSGFNAAVYVAGEVSNARRTVPRSLWIGTIAVTFLYLALNAIFIYAPTPEAIAGKPDVAAIAATALGGSWPGALMRAAISLALLSSVSSMIVAGPRVYARMSADGLFPSRFRLSAEDGRAPGMAIALQVGLGILVVSISTLTELLSYLGFTLSLSAAGTVACLFRIRSRDGTPPCVGYPWVPAVYVGGTVLLAALAAFHRPWELLAALLTIGSGLVSYRIFRRPNQLSG